MHNHTHTYAHTQSEWERVLEEGRTRDKRYFVLSVVVSVTFICRTFEMIKHPQKHIHSLWVNFSAAVTGSDVLRQLHNIHLVRNFKSKRTQWLAAPLFWLDQQLFACGCGTDTVLAQRCTAKLALSSSSFLGTSQSLWTLWHLAIYPLFLPSLWCIFVLCGPDSPSSSYTSASAFVFICNFLPNVSNRSEIAGLPGRYMGLLLLWCSVDAAGHLLSCTGTCSTNPLAYSYITSHTALICWRVCF